MSFSPGCSVPSMRRAPALTEESPKGYLPKCVIQDPLTLKVGAFPGEFNCPLISELAMPLLSLWKLNLEDLARALLGQRLLKQLLQIIGGNSFIHQTFIKYLLPEVWQLRAHSLDPREAPIHLLGQCPPLYFCIGRQISQAIIRYS